MPELTNILTSKYCPHSVLRSDFICTKLPNAPPLQSNVGSTGEKKNKFILITKKGFKGESRRYIRLFLLPVSCGKPELFAVSLDKQQEQQRLWHVCVTAFTCTSYVPKNSQRLCSVFGRTLNSCVPANHWLLCSAHNSQVCQPQWIKWWMRLKFIESRGGFSFLSDSGLTQFCQHGNSSDGVCF